jgi:hypothetical protein
MILYNGTKRARVVVAIRKRTRYNGDLVVGINIDK